MKIGYFFWGHLGDKLTSKTINTPDGNAWYSFSIIYELLKRGYEVYCLGIDRDKYDFEKFGYKIFDSFASKYRKYIYKKIKFVEWDLNKIKFKNKINLDLILLEWRFPIIYRNIYKDSSNFEPDLYMQFEILKQYKNKKFIILNLDYKLTLMDELFLKNFLKFKPLILETGNLPQSSILERILVDIPFKMDCKPLPPKKKNKLMVYIGNMYERNEMIKKYIIPLAKKYKKKIYFYGNWVNQPYIKIVKKYKWDDKIKFNSRVGFKDFYKIYSTGVACPLLAKKLYLKNGFMTARILESLYFGCLPIGFKEFYKIEKYLPDFLICKNAKELEKIILTLKTLPLNKYYNLILNIWDNLKFMDAKNFINKILEKL